MLYLGAALWIVLAGLDSSLATAAALLLMLLAAVGLYAGWVTAAFFLNFSTALVDAGVVEADEVAWRVVVLLAAAATLLALTVRAGGIPTYAAAGTWALIGIAVTDVSDGTTLVTTAAIASAVVLVAAATAVRTSGTRSAPPAVR